MTPEFPLLGFFFSLFAGTLSAEPSAVELALLRHGGSGCPQGTLSAVLSPDKQALSVLFDAFIADSAHRPSKRDCALDVQFRYPAGWQFSVVTVDYRGFAALDEKSWGKQDSHYRFLPGGKAMLPSHFRIKGPIDEDYYRRDENGVVPRGYSKCGSSATLRIDTSVQVGGPAGAKAMMTIDSIDKAVQQAYRLHWKACR